MRKEKNQEGKKMNSALTKGSYKGISLPSKKLDEISVKPKVRDGKVLLDKSKSEHRYLYDD